ncbi:MAG: GntR family transcriptional regulator [Acidobacteria bacterium]|nr:MAG: GntR family transcriptional regulator [Acidobacteriota bacterium]
MKGERMPLAASRDTRHRTKQEFVYRTLRDAIIRCELPPGDRLVIDDLARQLSVSAIPVREALQLLQSEGLAVNVPHVGATVAPISRESIVEVFTVMEGLEIVATRSAAQRAAASDLEVLRGIVDAMDRALAGGQPEQWADLNNRFHATIARLTGMPMLQEMMERALDRWDRVRRYYFSGVLVHRAEQAQQEHHALLAAIKSRDLPTLESLVRQHNQGALSSYTAYVQAVPAPPTI